MECSARCLTIVYPLDGDITWPHHQTAQLLNTLLSFSYEMDLFLYELMPVQCLCCVWEEVAETPQSMFSQSSSQVRQLIIGPTAGAEERASKYFWATEIFFCLQCRRPLVSGGVGSQHRTLRAAAVSRGALTSAIMGR